MNCTKALSVTTAVLVSAMVAAGANVRTDYDHEANFANYKTYSWGAVRTSNPFDVSRVKAEVDKDLQADGWQLLPSGGSATIFATGNVKNEEQLETMYNGVGGGWGGGWGWRRWGGFGGGFGPGGFGETTTTAEIKKVEHLILDVFDSSNHTLLFRGVAEYDLSNKASKDVKNLDKDIDAILKKLPKSAKS